MQTSKMVMDIMIFMILMILILILLLIGMMMIFTIGSVMEVLFRMMTKLCFNVNDSSNDRNNDNASKLSCVIMG